MIFIHKYIEFVERTEECESTTTCINVKYAVYHPFWGKMYQFDTEHKPETAYPM